MCACPSLRIQTSANPTLRSFFFKMRNNMGFSAICEVCGHISPLLVPLQDVQQRHFVKILEIFNLQMRFAPDTACEPCYLSLINFEGFLRRLTNPPSFTKWDMHSEPKDLTVSNKETEKHEYNCECEECQKKFGSLPLLAELVDRQSKDEILDLSVPSTSSSSDNKKPELRCLECNKLFTHRGDMNKHLRKHSGEQPYSCHICEKKFAHTSNLNRHLRVHSGEKPFKCTICDKSFSRKDKLQLHKKSKLCQKHTTT